MIPDKASFRQLVIQMIRENFPAWKTEPKDFGMVITTEKGKDINCSLDSLYVRLASSPQDVRRLLTEYLAATSDVVTRLGAENPTDFSFDNIKPNLFLAARGTDVADSLGAGGFSWPVLPDLAIYLAIDYGSSIAIVSGQQLTDWGKRSEEILETAYKNTVQAEQTMEVEVGKSGLVIMSSSRFQTIAHLLYWWPNLTKMIVKHAPMLSNELLLLAVPKHDTIILGAPNRGPTFAAIQGFTRSLGNPLLSESVYVFQNDGVKAKVMEVRGEKITAIPLQEWGLGSSRANALPYVPK